MNHEHSNYLVITGAIGQFPDGVAVIVVAEELLDELTARRSTPVLLQRTPAVLVQQTQDRAVALVPALDLEPRVKLVPVDGTDFWELVPDAGPPVSVRLVDEVERSRQRHPYNWPGFDIRDKVTR